MRITSAVTAVLALLPALLAIPFEADDASSQAIWGSPFESVDPPRNEGWIAKLLGAAGEGNINVNVSTALDTLWVANHIANTCQSFKITT